jgi:NCS1 family nucleobase:cation symporter-1
VIATLAGCFFAWIGKFVPELKPLYDFGWFVGFGVAALTHWLLMKIAPPERLAMETDATAEAEAAV